MSWLQVGNLSEKEAARDILKSIKLLDHCCLDWHVELEPGMALEWAKETEGYNSHDTQNLINIIKGINDIVPSADLGPDHSFTGSPLHKFHIGNESSLVIYLIVRKMWVPDEFDYNQLEQSLNEIAEANNADERDVVKNDEWSFKYRIWFD